MIDGISEDRVFDVKLDVVAEINAVIIQGGKALNGGGIRNNGTLTLNDVTVTANTAGDSSTSNGGGVLNVGTLTAVASRISGNDTTGSGAGIDNVGSATLTGTAVIGNIAAINGGGLNNISGGALTIEGGSRIETNTANSPATGGGGILAGNGTVTITDSTLRGNTAVTSGGAINVTSNAIVSLTDSTVSANSTSGGDCSGTVTTAGVNLDSDGTCAFALSSAAPGLDTLQDNGGPTFTHALLVGSPAINAALASACAARDHRGVLRPAAFCDIGAFERSLIDLIGDITWVPATDFDLDWFLNLSASNNGDDGASNVTGTVTLPPEVRFSSAPAECVLTSDETTGAETVTCDFGDLAAGASAAVDIRVTTVQSGAAVAGRHGHGDRGGVEPGQRQRQRHHPSQHGGGGGRRPQRGPGRGLQSCELDRSGDADRGGGGGAGDRRGGALLLRQRQRRVPRLAARGAGVPQRRDGAGLRRRLLHPDGAGGGLGAALAPGGRVSGRARRRRSRPAAGRRRCGAGPPPRG